MPTASGSPTISARASATGGPRPAYSAIAAEMVGSATAIAACIAGAIPARSGVPRTPSATGAAASMPRLQNPAAPSCVLPSQRGARFLAPFARSRDDRAMMDPARSRAIAERWHCVDREEDGTPLLLHVRARGLVESGRGAARSRGSTSCSSGRRSTSASCSRKGSPPMSCARCGCSSAGRIRGRPPPTWGICA